MTPLQIKILKISWLPVLAAIALLLGWLGVSAGFFVVFLYSATDFGFKLTKILRYERAHSTDAENGP